MEIRKIKTTYFLITGLYTLSASLIWGINTLFLLQAGLDIFGVFIANAVFTGSMSLFEIPTGVFADTRGRRFSFLLSTLILFLGTAGYVFAYYIHGGLLLFCIMSAVIGLGFTFYSGAVEAWIVDELMFAGFQGRLDTVFSQGAAVFGFAMLIGTVGGGFLGNADLSLPYIVRSGFLLILFFLALFLMKEKGFTPSRGENPGYLSEIKRVARESVEFGWKQKSIRLFMVASFFQTAFMMWGYYAWQPHFLSLFGDMDAVWISGIIAACVSLSVILGNALVPFLLRYLKKRTTLLIASTIGASLGAAGLGLVPSFWFGFGFLLLLMASTGMFMPVKQAYFHSVVPSDKRATVVSFDSLLGNGGGVLGQTGLGYVSKHNSIGLGYVIGSGILAAAVPAMFGIRRLKEGADLHKQPMEVKNNEEIIP